jgi:DNA-binding HxlR family transcriptional regulator
VGFVDFKRGFIRRDRFETIRSHTKMPKQTLANRLKKMTELGLLSKTPYQEEGRANVMSISLRQKAAAWRRSCFP